jgi:hypothetical protein
VFTQASKQQIRVAVASDGNFEMDRKYSFEIASLIRIDGSTYHVFVNIADAPLS